MFITHVPKFFWAEVVLTTAYLINRMPSQVLNFQTPCQVIFHSFPNTRILSTLPIKVFGCFTFVRMHAQYRSKIDPKSLKCIFVGYSSNQKRYKCYSPVTRRFYNSMDVTFFKQQPYYKIGIQGEHYTKEDQFCNIPTLDADIHPLNSTDASNPNTLEFHIIQPESSQPNQSQTQPKSSQLIQS